MLRYNISSDNILWSNGDVIIVCCPFDNIMRDKGIKNVDVSVSGKWTMILGNNHVHIHTHPLNTQKKATTSKTTKAQLWAIDHRIIIMSSANAHEHEHIIGHMSITLNFFETSGINESLLTRIMTSFSMSKLKIYSCLRTCIQPPLSPTHVRWWIGITTITKRLKIMN